MPPPQPSSAELAHEREVLEEMLASEGWIVFCRRVYSEWKGPGYFARMGDALNRPEPGIEAKVTHRTAIEIERAIQWPVDRVKHLKGSVE